MCELIDVAVMLKEWGFEREAELVTQGVTQLAAFRARDMEGCDAGCQPFSCGSTKHLHTCPNYPESYSRMIDELRAQLAEREPYVQHLETCDTWLFGSCDCGLDELLASHKEQSDD